MRSIAMVIALLGLAGCSAQPTPVETKSAPVKTASTTPAPAGPAAATSRAPETVAKKVPSGYRLEKQDGKEVYCRSEVVIGSKFANKMCFTREQLDEIALRTDSTMDAIGRGCVGERCGGE
jgi:hypothetical protein